MIASIFAGSADEWAVARRLQTGVARYLPSSQLPVGRLTRLAFGAAVLTPPAVHGRDGTQDPGDLGRVCEGEFERS